MADASRVCDTILLLLVMVPSGLAVEKDSRIVDPQDNRTLFTYFSEFEVYVWPGSLYLEVAFLLLILVAALVGNIMVIVIVCKFRKMRTTTNLLIASLACSDIIFSLGIPLIVTVRVTIHWVLGDAVCKVMSYIQFLSGTNSILTMMLISLDRYKTICHPHMKRLTLQQVMLVILGVWALNALFCIPLAMSFQLRDIPYQGSHYKFCGMLWPEAFNPSAYLGVMFLFLFILPLIVITFNYSRIFLTARRANRRVLRTRSLSALAETTRYSNSNFTRIKSSPQLDGKMVKVSFLIQPPPLSAEHSGAVFDENVNTEGHLTLPNAACGQFHISMNDLSATSTSGYQSAPPTSITSDNTTSTPLPSPNLQRRDTTNNTAEKVQWKIGPDTPRSNEEELDEKIRLQPQETEEQREEGSVEKRNFHDSSFVYGNNNHNANTLMLPSVVISDWSKTSNDNQQVNGIANNRKNEKNVKKKVRLPFFRKSSRSNCTASLRVNISAGNLSNCSNNVTLGTLGSSISNVQVKLIKMFVLIVILYIVMFTPFFILINLVLITNLHITSTVWTWVTICCLANTPQNPIIYGYFNENFRKAFKQIFTSCHSRSRFLSKSKGSPTKSTPKTF